MSSWAGSSDGIRGVNGDFINLDNLSAQSLKMLIEVCVRRGVRS